MTNKKSLSENLHRFENRSIPSHRFASHFISDIASSRTVYSLKR